MTKTTSFSVGGIDYNKEEATELRDELIGVRDNLLGPEIFFEHGAVVLTHAIGLMYEMIKHIWPD
jgi:hypothetical protein